MAFETRLPESFSRDAHERYAELCALFTSGSLTDDELLDLNAHVRDCESCARVLSSYRAVAKAVSVLTPVDEEAELSEKPAWVENARKRLLNSVEAERTVRQPQQIYRHPAKSPFRMFRPVTAAALVLIAGLLAGFSYHLGQVRGRQTTAQVSPSWATDKSQSGQMEALGRQLNGLEEQVASRSREVERLQHELQFQVAAMTESKATQNELQRDSKEQSAAIAALDSQKTALTGERDAALGKLQETQEALAATQQRLDALQAEHSRQLLRTASLQTRVDELSAALKESDEAVRRAEKFLVSDRDIRDLMGARDLYIADVFDIDREGKPQKAFGRVFYTAGKSLIFYAFDLDREPGVHDATFQAWGRRGPGDKRPLNMGVLYLDNAANKRWALRFDDPKVLNEIDAMFVTIEPKAGGQKPSGKQLLFASLRTPPNHP